MREPRVSFVRETAGAVRKGFAQLNLDCLADVIIGHFEKYMRDAAFEWFRMHRFQAEVTRLDDFLEEGRSSLSGDRIVAMKIDAESYEGQVLVGARRLLTTQKPLILAEGAHTTPLVYQTLLKLGYSYAGREGKKLMAMDGAVPSISAHSMLARTVSLNRKLSCRT